MTTLRRILITGGPDARGIRVVDAETGKLIEGIVKIELLCVPDDGALVNITQACRIEGIEMEARDAGGPLIDLPDEPAAGGIVERMPVGTQATTDTIVLRQSVGLGDAVAVYGDAPAKHALQAQLANIDEQLVAEGLPLALPVTPAVPIEPEQPLRTVLPPAPWPFPPAAEIGRKPKAA